MEAASGTTDITGSISYTPMIAPVLSPVIARKSGYLDGTASIP